MTSREYNTQVQTIRRTHTVQRSTGNRNRSSNNQGVVCQSDIKRLSVLPIGIGKIDRD